MVYFTFIFPILLAACAIAAADDVEELPTPAERKALVSKIQSVLRELKTGDFPRNPGLTTIRRLNRSEYNYTVRDLFGVNLEDQFDQYQRINTWRTEQYAYMLGRMKGIKKGDGTLLDHSMVAFGSPIRDGNSHNPRNVPIILAGGANGQLRTGRHLKFDEGTPLCSLWISMLDKAGVKAPKLGDADSGLKGV